MIPGNRSVNTPPALPLPPKMTGVVSIGNVPEIYTEPSSTPFTYKVAKLPS